MDITIGSFNMIKKNYIANEKHVLNAYINSKMQYWNLWPFNTLFNLDNRNPILQPRQELNFIWVKDINISTAVKKKRN